MRMNISVPDALAEQVRERNIPISAICQRALSDEVARRAAKLWIGTALTPHGNEYGLVSVVAETREEAMAKARAKLELSRNNYVRHERYRQALLDNLGAMRELDDEVFIDWDAADPRR